MAVMSPRGRFWLVTLAALAAFALTARLGWWQLGRAGEKAALQAAIDERAEQPVLQRADELLAPDIAALHHRRARLAGRWAVAHTVYLDNRQMNGKPGFYVVTPLLLHDGRALLVQRGWLPRDFLDRTRVAEVPTPAGDHVVVAGRLAPPPARLFEFDGGDAGRIRQNLDLTAFVRETRLDLLPLSLLQTEPAGARDAPLLREWPAPAVGIDRHYGYAVQWFGLAGLVAILYVWFQFIQPRRVSRRRD
jgi:surfeit locus 1 family protein